MSLKRNRFWLFAGALALLMGGPALGQGMQDADLGAPVNMDEFGGGPRPHEGLFLNYQGLLWTVSAPRVATFGVPLAQQTVRPVYWGAGAVASTTQQTTLDTGFLTTDWTGGQRIEFGNVDQHEGWKIGYLNLTRSTQRHIEPSVQVYLDDQPWGAPPSHLHLEGNVGAGVIQELGVEYDQVTLVNRVKVWEVDASYLRRIHPMPHGGLFEWSLGARYMEIREDFSAVASGGVLANTILWSEADNRLVGPHVGLRWFRTNDRWTLSLQGDFTGAVNMQTVRQLGAVGDQLSVAPIPRPASNPPQPLAMQALDFSHAANMQEFSPIVEVRLEAAYQVTQSVSIRGGWTGMWIGNVARPSGMVNYTLGETQTFGILTSQNRQSLFLNGLDLGVAINY
jgi:hypothetical protein